MLSLSLSRGYTLLAIWATLVPRVVANVRSAAVVLPSGTRVRANNMHVHTRIYIYKVYTEANMLRPCDENRFGRNLSSLLYTYIYIYNCISNLRTVRRRMLLYIYNTVVLKFEERERALMSLPLSTVVYTYIL